jgi:hypothetical protein
MAHPTTTHFESNVSDSIFFGRSSPEFLLIFPQISLQNLSWRRVQGKMGTQMSHQKQAHIN